MLKSVAVLKKTLAAEEHDSGCSKAKEVKEGGSVQVEVNNVFNGIPSPDMKPTEKTTYPSVLVKEKMSKVWERHHNCCNGNENVSDNCECQAKNGEVGISIKKREHQIKPGPTLSEDESGSSHSKEDSSFLLIKILKAELDLDVDLVNNDTEEITSNVKSCYMTTNTPTDTECELKQEF